MSGERFGVGAGWYQNASSALASLENSPRPSKGKGPSSTSALDASGAGILGGLFRFAVPFVAARGMHSGSTYDSESERGDKEQNRLAGRQAKNREGQGEIWKETDKQIGRLGYR